MNKSREEAVSEILRAYEEARSENSRALEERIKSANEKCPRIGEIVAAINDGGREMINKIKAEPSKQEQFLEEYRAMTEKLREEKEYLLIKHRIPSDYDKMHYNCDKCRDTGFLENGEKCACFEQKLIDFSYSQSDMGATVEKCNFLTFKLDCYSDKPMAGHELTPREYMSRVLLRAKTFCADFAQDGKGILLTGNPGLGKTFISSCIAKELMDAGYNVIYKRAARLFMMYNDHRFGRNRGSNFLDDLYGADLLIIDDLGVEEVSQSSRAFFIDLLDERIARGKKTVITTNLTVQELAKAYSSRFASRIYESFMVYNLYGEDIRKRNVI